MKDKTAYARQTFKVGELVRIAEGTDQAGIPPTRVGVVTSIGRDSSGFQTGIYSVLFASSEGTAELCFWHGFIEKVQS